MTVGRIVTVPPYTARCTFRLFNRQHSIVSLFGSELFLCLGDFVKSNVISGFNGFFDEFCRVGDAVYLCFEFLICLKLGYKLLCRFL